jgi:hypothetical protein
MRFKMPQVLPGALLTCVLVALSCCSAAAWEWDEQYAQRKQGVTLSAGNAHDANAITQMNDPWPRYVGNRRIPANGERMVGAVTRYRDVRGLRQAPPPIVPVYGTSIGVSGGSSGGGGGGGGGGTQ